MEGPGEDCNIGTSYSKEVGGGGEEPCEVTAHKVKDWVCAPVTSVSSNGHFHPTYQQMLRLTSPEI